ncbi:MAG TPA: PilZ domain-containing protein [Holophagaceae bacterium]
MTSPSHERAFPRVPIGYRVKLITDDQMITFASARNVSLGGILVDPTPSLPLGRSCGVAIFLLDQESGKRLVARGIVIRNDALGTAIQFTQPLDGSSQTLLEALIRSLSPVDPTFGTGMGAAG